MAFIKPNLIPNTSIIAEDAYWRIATFSESVKDVTNVVFYCYASKEDFLNQTGGVINSYQVDIPSVDLTGEGSYRELIYNWCAINEPFFANATRDDDEPLAVE